MDKGFNDVLKRLEIDNQHIRKVYNNTRNNKIVKDYYQLLADEYENSKYNFNSKLVIRYNEISGQIDQCNKFWVMDHYKVQSVKDFKYTILCKDKFCNNCKKVKQALRISKFKDRLLEFEKYGLKHMVLTIPNINISSEEIEIHKCFAFKEFKTQRKLVGTDYFEQLSLRKTIKHMNKCFRKLIRYLEGSKKIKDIDFSQWGYIGALKSLEITYKEDSYHPHFHVIMASNVDIEEKNIINQYSYSYGKLTRKFNKYEILIQKIWYLLFNNIKVTKKNIDTLEVGYSCIIDKIKEDDFLEVFKYMVKSEDEDRNTFSYDNFKILYFNLYNIRQIQGYGIFYNLKDVDLNVAHEVDEFYKWVIDYLKKTEEPIFQKEKLIQLIHDDENIIITRQRLYSHFKQLLKD